MASLTHTGRGPAQVNALELLSQGSPRDLRPLQIKLTYVGIQTKAAPSVVFTTFYHLVQMQWFLPLRQSDLNYANDDTFLWNFTVSPDEMKNIIVMLRREESLRNERHVPVPHLSLMVVLRDSRLGQVAFHMVLDRVGADDVTKTIYDALDPDNGLGRNVLDSQRQLIFNE
jgi:hypothetical protein